ncbi:MAG TPA: glycosyltransferase family 2 protein, partial [Bacteroidia bacterium]|nr:glycosyltransferase family 2 protein [Bacteroidia bacterium]
MKTAIVILNWNGKELLKKFLENVIEHSRHIAGVIIADNASTDGSEEFLKKNFPSVRIINFSENYGFAGGYNKALKEIDAEYYILLNSDVEVTAGWIEPVIEMMDNNPEIVCCQPKIKSWHNKEFFEHAGGAGGFIDKYGYPFCRGRLFLTLEKDDGQYNDVKEIFWATGACMFIRSKVFHEMNGFDSAFFAHMEEIDLCWRMQNKGYKIYCVPQSEVYHVGGGTLSKNNPGKTYLNFRNNLMMIHKNLPFSSLAYVFIIRLTLDGIAGIKFLFEGGLQDCMAVIKAHFYFYRHYSKRKQIRNEIQQNIKHHNQKNI